MDERDWIIMRLLIDANGERTYGRPPYNVHRTILYMQRRHGIDAVVDAIDAIHRERKDRDAQQSNG